MKLPKNYYFNDTLKSNIRNIICLTISMIVLCISILTNMIVKVLPDIQLQSYFSYLTCNIYRSTIVSNSSSSLKVEKVSKLKEKELESLQKQVSTFTFLPSFEPIVNNINFYIDGKKVDVNMVLLYPSTNTYKYNFVNYLYDECIVNQSFKEKYKLYNLSLDFSKTFKFENNFLLGKFKFPCLIKNVVKDSLFDNYPTIYFNILAFKDFISEIKLQDNFSLLDLINTDKEGDILNSYSYVLGVKNLNEIKAIEKVIKSSSLKLESTPLLTKKSFENIYQIISFCSYLFLIISFVSLLIISLIQTYIICIKHNRNNGYLISIGTDSFYRYKMFNFSFIFNVLISSIFSFLLLIFLYYFLNIDSLILKRLFLIKLGGTSLITLILLLTISFITFNHISYKKISSLIRAE